MKALIYEKFQGPLKISNLPDPEPKNHGVIIRVKATGLCRSDWHGWMGHDADIKVFPHVPGHELAGIVEIVGKNVQNFKIGDRVTVPFVCGCGSCDQCDSGNQQICDYQSQPGFTHWGSFAEYVQIYHADINLVHLPNSIDDVTAALLGCRFITSFRAIVEQGKVAENQYVAIHGCGGVGLSAVMIAHSLGAKVIAVDINEENLKLAANLGANYTINALNNLDIVPEIQEISGGGVHVSVDALGNIQTCFNSISNLRKRGKHIQVGLMTGQHQNPKIPMNLVIAKELEILGSHGMQAHKYPEMFSMINNGILQPKKLIQKTIPLHEVITALPEMDNFENKGVVVIDKF